PLPNPPPFRGRETRDCAFLAKQHSDQGSEAEERAARSPLPLQGGGRPRSGREGVHVPLLAHAGNDRSRPTVAAQFDRCGEKALVPASPSPTEWLEFSATASCRTMCLGLLLLRSPARDRTGR